MFKTYTAQNSSEAEFVELAIKSACYFAGRLDNGLEIDTNAPDNIVSEAVRDYYLSKSNK